MSTEEGGRWLTALATAATENRAVFTEPGLSVARSDPLNCAKGGATAERPGLRVVGAGWRRTEEDRGFVNGRNWRMRN